MKNTLRQIALKTTIVATLIGGSIGLDKLGDYVSQVNQTGRYNPQFIAENNSKFNGIYPEARDNQQLIIHSGYEGRGYTLLTDVDSDGSWDIEESVRAGYSIGDGSHTLKCKRGFGPSQSGFAGNAELVDAGYFKQYQN